MKILRAISCTVLMLSQLVACRDSEEPIAQTGLASTASCDATQLTRIRESSDDDKAVIKSITRQLAVIRQSGVKDPQQLDTLRCFMKKQDKRRLLYKR